MERHRSRARLSAFFEAQSQCEGGAIGTTRNGDPRAPGNTGSLGFALAGLSLLWLQSEPH